MVSLLHLTRAFSLPTRAFNLATRAFSVLTRELKLVTRRFELVTRGFELVTRNSYFIFPFFSFALIERYCCVFKTKITPNGALTISPMQIGKFQINVWLVLTSLPCIRYWFHSFIFRLDDSSMKLEGTVSSILTIETAYPESDTSCLLRRPNKKLLDLHQGKIYIGSKRKKHEMKMS